MRSCEYKGFRIDVQTMNGSSGGFVATVTLRVGADVREFKLPLDEDLRDEEEAVREGMQYGLELVDGLLPWFDPERYRAVA